MGYVVVVIFKSSFIDKETAQLSLSNYREFFPKTYYTSAILDSLIVSFGGIRGALLFGIPLAYLTARYQIRGKTLLATLAVLSLLSPPFMGAYSWIIMLGRNGFLRTFFLSLGITLPPIFGLGGIILVYTLQYYPFVFLLTSGSLTTVYRSIGSSLAQCRCTERFHDVSGQLWYPDDTWAEFQGTAHYGL